MYSAIVRRHIVKARVVSVNMHNCARQHVCNYFLLQLFFKKNFIKIEKRLVPQNSKILIITNIHKLKSVNKKKYWLDQILIFEIFL